MGVREQPAPPLAAASRLPLLPRRLEFDHRQDVAVKARPHIVELQDQRVADLAARQQIRLDEQLKAVAAIGIAGDVAEGG